MKRKAKIQQVLTKGMKKVTSSNGNIGPGMAVMVKYKVKDVFMGGVGYANIDKQVLITPDTIFDLASVSKHITVVGILLLKDKGLLKTSDPVSKVIDEFDVPGVTIEHLIWHTSGLADYTDSEYCAYTITQIDSGLGDLEDEIDTLTLEEHLLWLLKQPRKPPGKRHSYNNSGYVLLALIIERVSGLSFPQFYEDNIFSPLGMTSTTCIEPSNVALTYEKKRKGLQVCHWPTVVHGDGNIFTTLEDFSKWDRALTEGNLISQESWDWMCTPGKKAKSYGGGLEIEDNSLSHSGSWAGVQTYYYIQEEPPVSILTLSNIEHRYEDSIVDDILDLFE